MTRADSDTVIPAAVLVPGERRPAPVAPSASLPPDGASDSPFWLDSAAALAQVQSTAQGLSTAEAQTRAAGQRGRRLGAAGRTGPLRLLAGQFTSPISLLLVAAAVISITLRDSTDSALILTIVLASGLLGFWQEHGAAGAVAMLLSLVEVKASVLRDGKAVDVSLAEVVAGDVALLSAGATAPGDCLILESRDLFADEATLTDETFPAENSAGRLVWATLGVVALTLALPYLPIARTLGFVPLPLTWLVTSAIVALYIACGVIVKRTFYRRFDPAPSA